VLLFHFPFSTHNTQQHTQHTSQSGSFGGVKGPLPGSPYRIQTCTAKEYSTSDLKKALVRNSFAGQGSLQFEYLKDEIKSINLFIKSSSRTMGLNVKPGDIQVLVLSSLLFHPCYFILVLSSLLFHTLVVSKMIFQR
jgi:hypothetical protein